MDLGRRKSSGPRASGRKSSVTGESSPPKPSKPPEPPKRTPRPPPSPPTLNDAVQAFIAGPGSNEQLALVCDRAREMGVKSAELRLLRANVPVIGTGPTGDRCTRLRDVLTGLLEEVS